MKVPPAIRSPRRSHWVATILIALVFGSALAGWALGEWRDSREDFRLAPFPTQPAAPGFSLTDGEGRGRSLDDFKGRVVVIFFGFTRCPDACPAELFKLAQVMKQLGTAATRVQVVLITLDPERDTPALMKSYVAAFNPAFVGLTGTTSQIDKVAAAYHVAHFKVPTGSDYTVSHSTTTFVIDARGRERLMGAMDDPVAAYVHDLRELATQ